MAAWRPAWLAIWERTLFSIRVANIFLTLALIFTLCVAVNGHGRAQTAAAEVGADGTPNGEGVFRPARFYLERMIPTHLWDAISYSEFMRADRAARTGKWTGLETLYSADDPFCSGVREAVLNDYSRLAISTRSTRLRSGLGAGRGTPTCIERRISADEGYLIRPVGLLPRCDDEPKPTTRLSQWKWAGWSRGWFYSRNGHLHDVLVQSGVICTTLLPASMDDYEEWVGTCGGLGLGRALYAAGRGDTKYPYFDLLNVLYDDNRNTYPVYFRPITKGREKTSFEYLGFYITWAEVERIPGSRPKVTETLMCEFAEALGD